MKKLLVLLFSLLISFNSYGGWFDEKPNLDISCDNFAKFAKGTELNNMFGGTSKILKVSKPTEICRSKSKLVCVGDLKVSTGFKNMKMRMEVYRDDDGDVYWELSTFANLFSDDATGYDATQCMTETEIRNQKEKKLDDGKKRTYFDNGNKKSELSYTNDKLDGTQIYWHSNGKKSAESNYKLGIKDGKQSWWFTSGQIRSVEYYKNNLKNGGHFTYWENGNKQFSGRYKDGKKHGKFTWWTIDEKIQSAEEYINNELVPEVSEINNSEDTNSSSKDVEVTLSCKEITDRNKRLECYDSLSVIDEQIEELDDSSVISLELTNDEVVAVTVLETNKNDTNNIKKEFYDNGQKKSEISYKDGQIEKERHYKNDQIEKERHYKSGTLISETKYGYYEDGIKKFEINYKNGVYDGQSIEWYDNGQKKVDSNYKNGVIVGKLISWHMNGQKEEESHFSSKNKGKRDGAFVEWYENGQKFTEGRYTDSKKDGLWTVWYENGFIKTEKHYKSGSKEGKWTKLYENGNIQLEENYISNQLRDSTNWFSNGQKAEEGKWIKGQKDGKWKIWNRSDSDINITLYYTKGKLSNITNYEYYPNDILKSVGKYSSGLKTRTWTSYHENGVKSSVGKYSSGVKNGKWTTWDEVGEKRSMGKYLNGLENGKWTYWDLNGEKISKKYQNGVCISGDCPS